MSRWTLTPVPAGQCGRAGRYVLGRSVALGRSVRAVGPGARTVATGRTVRAAPNGHLARDGRLPEGRSVRARTRRADRTGLRRAPAPSRRCRHSGRPLRSASDRPPDGGLDLSERRSGVDALRVPSDGRPRSAAPRSEARPRSAAPAAGQAPRPAVGTASRAGVRARAAHPLDLCGCSAWTLGSAIAAWPPCPAAWRRRRAARGAQARPDRAAFAGLSRSSSRSSAMAISSSIRLDCQQPA